MWETYNLEATFSFSSMGEVEQVQFETHLLVQRLETNTYVALVCVSI